MDNYKGKSKANQDHDDDHGNNNISLDLKLGQSTIEEQNLGDARYSNGGVHSFSSMEGQSTYNLGNYSMFGGERMNPNVGFANPSLMYWPNELYQRGLALQNHNRKRPNAHNGKVCRSCGSGNTPLWRKGPDGPQTLCNACGLRHIRNAKKGEE